MPDHFDFSRLSPWLTRGLVTGAATLVIVGGFGAGWWTGSKSTATPPTHQADAAAQTCAAFGAIGQLTDEARHPGPNVSTQPPDFIDLSSAMNNARAAHLSDQLDAAVTTYVYALANLGAVFNARESINDIESMRLIVDMSAHTVATLCRSSDTAGPQPLTGNGDELVDEPRPRRHDDHDGAESKVTDSSRVTPHRPTITGASGASAPTACPADAVQLAGGSCAKCPDGMATIVWPDRSGINCEYHQARPPISSSPLTDVRSPNGRTLN